MSVKIYNLTGFIIALPDPVDSNLPAHDSRTYLVNYDDLIIDERFLRILDSKQIRIEDLSGITGDYVSQWNQEPKLRLAPYTFWVDSLGFFRMKGGNPTFDLDGVVIGPGAGGPVPPHGSTHVFNGTDPIPKIEVLEGAWSCTVTEQVGNAVFESVANSVRQANASSTATMPVVGIIISKPTPTATTCTIARSGEVTIAGLTVGQEYYASTTPGQLTTTVPTATGHVAQYVGYAKNTNTLVVQLRNPVMRA